MEAAVQTLKGSWREAGMTDGAVLPDAVEALARARKLGILAG